MDFFNHLTKAKDDPILNLVVLFNQDQREFKQNLSIGVYFDESGQLVNFDSTDHAQLALAKYFYNTTPSDRLPPVALDAEVKIPAGLTTAYLPSAGFGQYNQLVKELVFGADSAVIKSGRVETMETIAGSGGLRAAADFLKKSLHLETIACSDPTWSNHYQIFADAGLKTTDYAFYDAETKGINFSKTLADLAKLDNKSAVCFHACCHNPTGYEFSHEQWKEVLTLCKEKGIFVFFDMAYQGFGKGIDEDAYAVRLATELLDEFIVVSSCSKNFGLYGERIGALHVVAKNAEEAKVALSNVVALTNNHYVAPGANGAYIVTTVLSNPELKAQWLRELAYVRNRIQGIRTKFAQKMRERGVNFDFIEEQTGMFSYTGLNEAQVQRLQDEFAIYMVSNGRINVVGLNDHNMDYVADCFVKVLAD